HLLFHLFLHLKEYALSFFALTGGLLHTCECLSELLAEAKQIRLNFDFLVEGHTLRLVVDHCLNKTFAVALEE
ncbi:MAG: hypothetical protein ACK55I_30105, partial [bacterium]